ncbi:MAG: response regulator transcription factor [Bdellovibrionales bacterium]|nr:response regulator transcription factor [Bdellovibrionales bacterium]
MINKTVLVVEDDDDIALAVRHELESLGHTVKMAGNGELALAILEEKTFDLVVLDLKLPRLDGLEVLRSIRGGTEALPVLILSAESEESDIVLGLELGADDYLTKPFSPRELRARVRAILSRVEAYRSAFGTDTKTTLEFGKLQINLLNRTVHLSERLIELTRTEYHLLYCLASRPGRVFSREELIAEVSGYFSPGYENSITPHISRLRSKLEPNPAKPIYLHTVRGLGYRFAKPEECR